MSSIMVPAPLNYLARRGRILAMDKHESNRPVGRIQQLRKRKLCRLVRTIMADQPDIPHFVETLTSISKKKKIMSILFFSLLVINLSVCVYQSADRILFLMNEPTTVDAHLIETTHGPYPYVYISPRTTQEYNDYLTKRNKWKYTHCTILWYLAANMQHDFSDAIKYLSIHNYVTDAYYSMGKSRVNLTVQNYESAMMPTAQASTSLQLPYGNNNCKIVINLNFAESCDFYYGLIDPSPIKYQVYFENYFYMPAYKKFGNKFYYTKHLAAVHFQKYHFINTKRKPCDNNLHDCLRPCLLEMIKCRYPFYDAINLPKCNDTYLRKAYTNWKDFIYSNTDVIKHCKCLDLCDVTQQSIMNHHVLSSRQTSIEVHVVDKYVRTLTQRFCYDLISLLCDVGGNIGLYFGISCLTIIEICVYFCKMPVVKLHTRRKPKSKIKNKIQTVLKSKKKIENQTFARNKLKYTLLIFLIVISGYNVYNSINSYFDFPITKTVILVRDDYIQFPAIIDCTDNVRIDDAKLALAKKLKSNCLNYQLVDLLHPLSEFANDSLKLWSASTNFAGHYIRVNEQDYYRTNRAMEFANISEFSTVFGLCTEIKAVELPYGPNENTIFFRRAQQRYDTFFYKCREQQPTLFLPQNQFVHPKYVFYLYRSSRIEIDFLRQTLIRLNTPKSPCQANDLLISECEQKCYGRKLDHQSIKCRLPFMDENKLPLCQNLEMAEMTRKMYLETQFKTHPQKDCSCLIRCEETIFLPTIKFQDVNSYNEITYRISSNIREEIEEKNLITIIKLVCQVGSIISILTGLSIFGLIEFFTS